MPIALSVKNFHLVLFDFTDLFDIVLKELQKPSEGAIEFLQSGWGRTPSSGGSKNLMLF